MTHVVAVCDNLPCPHAERATCYGQPPAPPPDWKVINGYTYCPGCWKHMQYLKEMRK